MMDLVWCELILERLVENPEAETRKVLCLLDCHDSIRCSAIPAKPSLNTIGPVGSFVIQSDLECGQRSVEECIWKHDRNLLIAK